MSARELEDFIKVIETAEKIEKRPASSIWSYPTDVFTRTSSPRRITPRPSAPPNVPKLWDPKAGSDFLGSSWGSSCKSGAAEDSTPRSAVPQSTSSKTSQLTTVRSATPSSTRSRSSVKNISAGRVEAKVVNEDGLRDLNILMNMQRHNRFARRQAKELLSSISPSNSPRPARKSSSKSPSNTKTKNSSTSRSPSSRKPKPSSTSAGSTELSSPQKASTTADSSMDSGDAKSKTPKSSSSSTPKSKNISSSSGSKEIIVDSAVPSLKKASYSSSGSALEEEIIEDIEEDIAPSNSPFKVRKPLARSVKINVDDEGDEEPRPLPKPRARPRNADENDTKTDAKNDNTKKNRPKSAPTPKKKVLPPPTQQELVDLRSYSKSLKLLGLEIPSNRTEATKVTTLNMEIRTKSPTMRTRLKERTQSVSDLREVVDSKHHLPKEEYGKIKAKLTNAVFEEWYFNKMKEYSEKKHEEMEKIESKIYQKELEDEEKKEKAAEEFKKWLDEKKKQYKKEKMKQKNDTTEEEKEAKVAKIKKAEEEWKMTKAADQKKKEKLKRRLQKKQEQEKEKQNQKREQASKHFMEWEQNWRQKMKAKMVQDKQKAIEELEAKKIAAKEKREDAEAAFNAWKNKKKEDTMKKKPIKAPGKEVLADIEKEKRLEDARDAYENWLEYIEQRDEEDKCAEQEKELRFLWRPPWYPAGIADY